MNTNVPKAQDIADAQRSKALSYARKTGTAIDLAVIKGANAKHEYSLAPVKLYYAIQSNLSPEEISSLPRPGSKWKEKGVYTNNADIVEWKDPSKPNSKAKEVSFYVVWADNTPEGSKVVQELEWCSRIGKENMVIDDIPVEWRNKYASNPTALDKQKKYLEGRRSTVRKQYKDTVRLIWQMDMVNELDGVTAELGDENDNTVIVSNKLKPKQEWKLYSIGSFLKLDPLKASEQDGSYAALEATAKREKPPEQNKTELKLNAVATPETSDKVATVWHSYLAHIMADKKGDQYAAYIRHLGSDGGKQALVTLAGIETAIKGILSVGNLRSIADIEIEKIRQLAA